MPNPVVTKLKGWLGRKPPTGLAGALFWLIIWFFLTWLLRLIPGETGTFFGVLEFLIVIALCAVAIPLLLRFVRKRMLWSLRSKLILTYLLIGLAPVILGLTLVTISTYIAAGQFAVHLADTRVQGELEQMSADNAGLVARIVPIFGIQSSAEAATRTQDLSSSERAAANAIQRPRLHRRLEAFVNGVPLVISSEAHPSIPLGLPAWAVELPHGSFHSLVVDGGETYLVSINQQRLHDGRLFTLVSSLPVDPAMMEFVAEGLGRAGLSPEKTEESGKSSTPPVGRQAPRVIRPHYVSGGLQPPSLGLVDIPVHFFSTFNVIDWETGKPDSVPINVDSRPSLLYLQLFGASLSGVVTSAIRIGLIALCILFALIETTALVMAIRLSRTMTASVHDLYEATRSIDRGDFDHRIAVSRTDQLAELSHSFNGMTVSLQRLLVEQQEKERLQNELSIAQEVQANLFPTEIRDLPMLELHGFCRPARSVSGDYYDFLVFHKNDPDGERVEAGVGIALGDISGKGISAALLMANLHSAVRAYRFASESVVYSASSVAGLTASRDGRAGDAGELFASPARIMALLNRHLYRSTTPEKYATLFLAHYDAATHWLTYSNAGQLPPLLIGKDGGVRRLDMGGTVVGLMDGMRYEEGRFLMVAGDILVAYSDGVTEPENDFGDFGEERLLEVVTRYRDQPLHIISTQVMAALDAWIGADEQPDDITLVLARQR